MAPGPTACCSCVTAQAKWPQGMETGNKKGDRRCQGPLGPGSLQLLRRLRGGRQQEGTCASSADHLPFLPHLLGAKVFGSCCTCHVGSALAPQVPH